MADVDNAGPVKPTNKICWFNFSSYLFNTSNSSQQTLQGSAQVSSETPKSSPARRRSSPRFNNAGNISQQADYPSSCNPTSSCCLTKDSCSKCCSPSKLLGSKMKKNSTLSSINNASGKKQRSPQQYCLDESEDFPTSQAAAATPQNHHSYLDHGHCMQNLTHGLPAHEAPHYLTFNPFITGGYRNNLTPIDCIKRYILDIKASVILTTSLMLIKVLQAWRKILIRRMNEILCALFVCPFFLWMYFNSEQSS